MLRVLLYLLVGGYLLYKIQQFFSKKPLTWPSRLQKNEPHEELLEDPVCHTFVTHQEAHIETFDGKKQFFCSRECAKKFAQSL